MALTPTEREEHFFKAMVDAADGNTPEELEPTERREHWYKEIIDAIKAGGGGSGGGVLVVNDTSGTLDKTWQEIHDAPLSVLRQEGETLFYIVSASEEDSTFIVAFSSIVDNATATYTASSASGYPVRFNE